MGSLLKSLLAQISILNSDFETFDRATAPFTVSATASSGLAVSFASSHAPAICVQPLRGLLGGEAALWQIR
jgi:hypothetical protein